MGRYRRAFKRAPIGVVVLSALALVAGCDDGPTACTCESVPGISIKILDAETGLPAACDARIQIVEGDDVEFVEPFCVESLPDSLQIPWVNGAHENAGLFSVLIEKDGYEPWSLLGVLVTRGECHVHTVELEALLEPSP